MTDKADGLIGKIEYASQLLVKGYAVNLDQPGTRVGIEVVANGAVRDTFTADAFRWDLKQQGIADGCCGFVYSLPSDLMGNGTMEFEFRFRQTDRPLEGSPVVIDRSCEARHAPIATTDLTGQRVLVLAPHPDDESLACGGALILHRAAGDPVKVVFLTDGSRADLGGEYSPEDYVRLREDEAREAADVLGIDDLEFWRIADRTLAEDTNALERLSVLLADYRPTLIYAPSPMESHPDHRAAAGFAWRAVQHCHAAARLAFYDYNRPVNVNTLVDVSKVITQKKRACSAYRSQHRHHPYSDCAVALNRYRALSVSPGCEYAEGFFLMHGHDAWAEPVAAFCRRQLLPTGSDITGTLPLVSVIIRTKDRPILLREAISSVMTQTYPALQVVVVNDGGADVGAIIREFDALMDIRQVIHPAPLGRAAAANAGAAAAGGVYLNFLDDDDVFYSQHVDRLAGYLHASGEDFAYSDCEMAHYRWEDRGFVAAGPKAPYKGVDYDRDRLYLNNFIPMMTAMFSRRLWELCGGMDDTLDVFEDWDLWLRMSAHATFCRLPGITAEYRVFSTHDYDYRVWRRRIYEKHRDHWSLDRLVDWTWPFVEALENRLADTRQVAESRDQKIQELFAGNSQLIAANDGLNKQNQGLYKQLAHSTQRLTAIEGSYAWKLAGLPSRWLPPAVMQGAHRAIAFFLKKIARQKTEIAQTQE